MWKFIFAQGHWNSSESISLGLIYGGDVTLLMRYLNWLQYGVSFAQGFRSSNLLMFENIKNL